MLLVGGAVVLAACDRTDTAGSARSETEASSTTTGATTTTAPPPITYQVERGDTLSAIASVFGVSGAAIAELNQLANPDQLTEGQVLEIPVRPPVWLGVLPTDAPAGTLFKFALTGAEEGEGITFQVTGPDGAEFTGSPHLASPEGTVMTEYRSAGDPPGTYTVVATGSRGTSAQATYNISERTDE